eukprot:SAG31_NODE_783_length_12123_cov_5.272130_8_plen_221_part_00
MPECFSAAAAAPSPPPDNFKNSQGPARRSKAKGTPSEPPPTAAAQAELARPCLEQRSPRVTGWWGPTAAAAARQAMRASLLRKRQGKPRPQKKAPPPSAGRPSSRANPSAKGAGADRPDDAAEPAPLLAIDQVIGTTSCRGSAVASHPTTPELAYAAGAAVVVYDPSTDRQALQLPTPSGKPVGCLAFSPDGKLLAAGECGQQPAVRCPGLLEFGTPTSL